MASDFVRTVVKAVVMTAETGMEIEMVVVLAGPVGMVEIGRVEELAELVIVVAVERVVAVCTAAMVEADLTAEELLVGERRMGSSVIQNTKFETAVVREKYFEVSEPPFHEVEEL